MTKIVAVTSCPTGIAHSYMAAEALKKTATMLGHDIKVETHGAEGVKNALADEDIRNSDVVIIAADIHVSMERFNHKPVEEVSTSRAIRDTATVVDEAVALAAPLPAEPAAPPIPAPEKVTDATSAPADTQPGAPGRQKLVAVTACPTGIAHTFMAADALKKAASGLGHEIKVETQGSVGAKNQLTPEEIAAADAVVIAADTHVDLSRFQGKRIYQTSTGTALKEGRKIIGDALTLPPAGATAAAAGQADYAQTVKQAKATQSEKRAGPYKHLLTGVSYMLPIVVAGGLIIALSFVFGIDAAGQPGSLAAALMDIGKAAFALIVPVLAGFIAFSIADRPGLAPGLIGGMLAATLQAGFLGGLIAGFLAGYVALFLREHIRLPQNFEGLKPVLIIPLLSTLIVGLLMVYVVGTPVRAIMEGLTGFLQSMGTTNAVLLGLLLGGMMAVDMGGPVNKAAYTFAVGLLASNTFQPMAAVMAAGMTPPLGLALATVVAKNRFSRDEREAGKAAAVLGISFITEGAIPFAAKDPLRVIPACIVGAAVTGALSMLFGCGLRAPHGGIFVLAIPNAVSNVLLYALAIAAGAVVTAVMILLLKRPLAEA